MNQTASAHALSCVIAPVAALLNEDAEALDMGLLAASEMDQDSFHQAVITFIEEHTRAMPRSLSLLLAPSFMHTIDEEDKESRLTAAYLRFPSSKQSNYAQDRADFIAALRVQGDTFARRAGARAAWWAFLNYHLELGSDPVQSLRELALDLGSLAYV